MSLVTKKNPQILVYLDRSFLAIYSPQLVDIAQLPFAEGWVKDLEMTNLNDFSAQFSLFLTKLSLPPSEAVLVLSKSIYFLQEIIDTKPAEATPAEQAAGAMAPLQSNATTSPNKPLNSNSETIQRQEFVRSVPFSDVFSAVISLGKHKSIIALNRDLYDPVLKILDSHHLKVVKIYPDSAIPQLTDQTLTPEIGKNILATQQKWMDANLLHTQLEETPGKIQVMPAKNAPERKRLVLMGLGFSILILVFGGFLFYTLQKNAADKAAIDAKRAEIKAAAASASAQLLLSSTPSPAPATASNSAQPIFASQAATLRILVLNGTGISGQAATVQKALQQLNYDQVTTGNTTTLSGGATQLVVQPTVSAAVRQQLLETLASLQFTAKITESAEITDDIRITLAQQAANDNL